MGWLGRSLTGVFLSPVGLFFLAAAESTVFFWFPFGVDAAVIVLVARSERLAWLYPVLATVGSISGTALTFWMGIRAGEAGVERYVPKKRLESITARIKKKGAVALALLGIIPPPFPFTALVLAAGALRVKRLPFFATLTAVRLVRFGLEALLAARFGTLVIRWLNSDVLEYIVVGFAVLMIAGTAVSIYALRRRAVASRRAAPELASAQRPTAT